MKNKTKQLNTNKKTKQIDNDDKMINVNNVMITIDEHKNNLLRQLSNAKHDVKLQKSIRNKLRKQCNHYGALRNRTYIDKSNAQMNRIVIDKQIETKIETIKTK